MDRSSNAEHVRVGMVVADTEAAGPGRRLALWTQGCSLLCKGCCNPEMLDARGGRSVAVAEVVAQLRGLAERGRIEGVSFLGGEPFEQATPLARIAGAARELGLSVMVFSGYRLEELRAGAEHEAGVRELLSMIDVLVDGRFEASRLDTSRRWIGSSNQRACFLGPAIDPSDPRFSASDTVEIRLERGAVVVNGTPRASRRVLSGGSR